jgi:hypothetical protein
MHSPIARIVGCVSLACGFVWGATSFGQITANQASWVLSRQDDVARKTADYLKESNGKAGSNGGANRTANSDVIELVTKNPSEWRFHSRDRGILIAIDVPKGTSPRVQLLAQKLVAEAAVKVIRQEQDMAIANYVRVVVVDPSWNDMQQRSGFFSMDGNGQGAATSGWNPGTLFGTSPWGNGSRGGGYGFSSCNSQ